MTSPSTTGFRLAAWYTGLFLVSTIGLIGLCYALLASSLQQRDQEIIASSMSRYLSEYRRSGLEGLDRVIASDAQASQHERLLVRVVDRGAAALFVSMPADWRGIDITTLDRAGEETGFVVIEGIGSDASLEVQSVRFRDGTLFQVGKSTENRREILRRFRTIVGWIVIPALVVALIGGSFLTSRALRPVRELTETVQEIVRTGRLATRVPVRQSGDPLDELSSLFNGMLDRIESLMGAMRGSLDNVAHDLRTPMTRLRNVAEAALQGPDDRESYREALADCLEESERVVAMLSTLMDISEAETGSMQLALESVPVRAILDEAREMYADLAEEKQVKLSVDAPVDVTVTADPNRLRQVIFNLVDNAVKYTNAGGEVVLTVTTEGDAVLIRVRDTGIGIPAHEVSRIWDRLYRGDKSRSERGLGLGLSLVKAIIQAHGGTVEVQSAPGEGTTIELRLPVAPSTGHSAPHLAPST